MARPPANSCAAEFDPTGLTEALLPPRHHDQGARNPQAVRLFGLHVETGICEKYNGPRKRIYQKKLYYEIAAKRTG